MRILAFEYACAGGANGGPFLDEGKRMLSALLDDLSRYHLETLTTLHHPSLDLAGLRANRFVPVTGNLFDSVAGEITRHDVVWIIAPESGGLLWELTRMAETRGVSVAGSSSHAVDVCGNKFLAWRRLNRALKLPETHRFTHRWDRFPCVVKPMHGAGTLDTFLVRTREELKGLDLHGDAFIVQPYIEGVPFSAAVASRGNSAELLGVCRQTIRINAARMEFSGVEGPLEYPRRALLESMAERIQKHIPGLNGYWGIDFIDAKEEPILIEINPRLTSSYPLYRNASGFNIPWHLLSGTAT